MAVSNISPRMGGKYFRIRLEGKGKSVGKNFFFEKKKQKTFFTLGHGCW
jgi:hypothetical protein